MKNWEMTFRGWRTGFYVFADTYEAAVVEMVDLWLGDDDCDVVRA